MQVVFAVGATALFVPVIFHTTTVSETDSLNKDAPGKYKAPDEKFCSAPNACHTQLEAYAQWLWDMN